MRKTKVYLVKGWVEKCLTRFRTNSHTINMSFLVS
jgi:hypothetical protein